MCNNKKEIFYFSAYGIPPSAAASSSALARNPIPSRPRTPSAIFTGEHKVYALHILLTTNYKLPPDLDRCNLEKHLCPEDFEFAFGMSRKEFYSLPTWKRNEMKKRAHLF